MTRRPSDAVPEGADSALASPTPRGVEAAEVADYLRQNPDFLADYPDLLESLTTPARWRGDGVIDLQHRMVERLRDEVSRLRSSRDELLLAGRTNLVSQGRIHDAVLSLLRAESFAALIETATIDLAVLLDVDVVAIVVESGSAEHYNGSIKGVVRLPAGSVDRLMPAGQKIVLRDEVAGDRELFGSGAGLVRSEALLRLEISEESPPALIAFGSRQSGQFHPGQGTELLRFLGRVLELTIRAWLNLPN